MLLCVSTIILYFLFQVLTVAKCALSILQLNCNPYFREEEIGNLSSCAHVVHLRHNISRRRKDKNGYEMSSSGKSTCKAWKTTVFHHSKYRLVTFTSPSASYRCLTSLMRQLWNFFSLSHIVRNIFSFEPITRISGNILCERVISF